MWDDNIRERTGLEFGKSQRVVENRGKWKTLVVKSYVDYEDDEPFCKGTIQN